MSKKAERRLANAAAAKQKRQKVIAFGGMGVLVILMAIQGPKLLDAVGGSESPSTTALAVTPAVPAPANERRSSGRALRLLKANGADPFASHQLASKDPPAGDVLAPAGTHDPFAGGGGSSAVANAATNPVPPAPADQPLPNQIVVGTPRPGAVAKRGGWIVVLASIQTRVGREAAERFATRVRLNGLGGVSVLDSSNRKPLRAGYYVVYTGPFESLSAVQRSAAHVHAFGYRTAYVREILRY